VLAPLASAQAQIAPEFGADGGPEGDADTTLEMMESEDFGLPAVLREDEPATDPSLFEEAGDILPERYLIRSVPWSAPDYSKQEGSLGWAKDTFNVPPELAIRVRFWKDVYAKYTTDQGVLHDIEDLSVVYEDLDFTPIMREKKTLAAKARARTSLVNAKRKEIRSRLERLSNMRSARDVKGETDRRYLAYFTKDGAMTDQAIARLFEKSNAKELQALRSRLKAASTKRRVRFQLGQKDKFILGIYYSGRYLREMEKVFRSEKMPVELTRLPFVESSFNIQARSRVGASGVWQFMPRTAKPWMLVSSDVDERNDPMTATVSAARLLKANYDRLQTWPLALTAYNHGAAGVARAVRVTGSRDLPVIIEKYRNRRFGFASSNFYACFLAALEVEKEARALLGDVKWSLEFDGVEVDLTKRDFKRTVNWNLLVSFYDGDSVLAELQNPHLTSRLKKSGRELPKKTFIRVPSSRAEIVSSYLSGKTSIEELKRVLALTPIPRSDLSNESKSEKLGEVSESMKAILPFVAPVGASDGKANSPAAD
jgi:hypothetical protein